MKLFLDTETTGKPKNYNAPMSDVENFPRLVQLGYIVQDNDGTVINEMEFIIRPSGFVIPEEASRIHGITHANAVLVGLPIENVLDTFSVWLKVCDTVIGHNVPFDISVIGAEYWRLHAINPFAGKRAIDTMRSGTDFCQLPGNYGKYKFPKLAELYEKLFNEPMGAAHTALQDIQNTAKCYHAMVERGIIKN